MVRYFRKQSVRLKIRTRAQSHTMEGRPFVFEQRGGRCKLLEGDEFAVAARAKLCPGSGKISMPITQHVWQKIGKNCRSTFRRTTSSMSMRSSAAGSDSAGLIPSSRPPKNMISGTWLCFLDSVPTCGRKIAGARQPWTTFPWRHCNGTWFVNTKTLSESSAENSQREQRPSASVIDDEAVVGAAWHIKSCYVLLSTPHKFAGVLWYINKNHWSSWIFLVQKNLLPTHTSCAINCTACKQLHVSDKRRDQLLGGSSFSQLERYIIIVIGTQITTDGLFMIVYPSSIWSQRNFFGNATLQTSASGNES